MSTQAQTVAPSTIDRDTRMVHFEATPGTFIALCGYVSQHEPYYTDDSAECVVCIDLANAT